MEAGWPPLFVLTDQGASLIAVSIDVMRDLIKNGEVPFVKNGHRYTIDRCDLDKWIEGKKNRGCC
jgi:excisionase family DNA binding protein